MAETGSAVATAGHETVENLIAEDIRRRELLRLKRRMERSASEEEEME
jgi:hypothetical protein